MLYQLDSNIMRVINVYVMDFIDLWTFKSKNLPYMISKNIAELKQNNYDKLFIIMSGCDDTNNFQ